MKATETQTLCTEFMIIMIEASRLCDQSGVVTASLPIGLAASGMQAPCRGACQCYAAALGWFSDSCMDLQSLCVAGFTSVCYASTALHAA
jgi:hypothetical protein